MQAISGTLDAYNYCNMFSIARRTEKPLRHMMKLGKRSPGKRTEFLRRVILAKATQEPNSPKLLKVILRDLVPSRDAKGGSSDPLSKSGLRWACSRELPKQIQALQAAIAELHGCEAVYRRTEYVRHKFNRYVAWDGLVCIFKLRGHATAKYCYAWCF